MASKSVPQGAGGLVVEDLEIKQEVIGPVQRFGMNLTYEIVGMHIPILFMLDPN